MLLNEDVNYIFSDLDDQDLKVLVEKNCVLNKIGN